jgi:F0F1-type ATP synthase delta subunit
MASRASARRYARALFDVVTKSGDVDAALVELKALGAAFTGHGELRKALTSPGVPLGVKQSVMRDVLALQPVSKVVARLLTLVVENDDIDEIDEIVEAFEQRVLDLHHVVRAEITSAVPITGRVPEPFSIRTSSNRKIPNISYYGVLFGIFSISTTILNGWSYSPMHRRLFH